MIDCARPARKKPENVLLASAFTHLRLRFPFVKALLSVILPRSLAPPEAIPSPGTPVYIASCLVASSLRSPPLSSPSLVESPSSHPPKRYYVAHARAALRSLRSMPCATLPYSSFSFFISNLPPASFNLSRFL